MTGPELANILEQHEKGLRVLFMSGYPGEAVARHGLAKGSRLLRKPFEIRALGLKIREALGH